LKAISLGFVTLPGGRHELEKVGESMTVRDAGIRMSFSEDLQPAKIKVIGVGGGVVTRSTA